MLVDPHFLLNQVINWSCWWITKLDIFCHIQKAQQAVFKSNYWQIDMTFRAKIQNFFFFSLKTKLVTLVLFMRLLLWRHYPSATWQPVWQPIPFAIQVKVGGQGRDLNPGSLGLAAEHCYVLSPIETSDYLISDSWIWIW